MRPELIVMLTHHDKTVKNAIEVFDECKDMPIQYWGFKNVGLERDKMRTLIENMKAAGKTTFLEVVTYSEEECMAGAKTAVEFGFDYLMGTIYYESVNAYMKKQGIGYYPFCGKVSGSPSVLEGGFEEIIAEAKEMISKGIKGFDLLAYRHKQGQQLAYEFCKAVDASVVIAGSINSYERLDIMKDLSPFAFTMGTALFDGDFDKSLGFKDNLSLVIDYMNK